VAADLRWCILGNLLLRLGNSATGVLMGLVLAAMDRTRGDVPAIAVGLLAASFYATELIGAPIFGTLSDRLGRRRFMLAGPICGGIAVQLIGWPTLFIGWPFLLVSMALGRMIEGLSTATSAPATLSLLSADTADSPPRRAQVMAWYEKATLVGIAGGFIEAGVLWDWLGHGAFPLVTVMYVLSFLVFWGVHDRSRFPVSAEGDGGQHEHAAAQSVAADSGSGLWAVLQRPRVLRFVPAWLFVNTVVGVWFTHSAFQLTGVHHRDQWLTGSFSGSGLGLAFALSAGAFMGGIYLWGMAIGTRSKTTIMLFTLAGLYWVCGALYLINHTGQVGGMQTPALTSLYLFGILIASGFTPAALAYLADLSEEMASHRGAVMGLYSVILGLGQLLGGALGGPFAQFRGVDGLILLTAILTTGALAAVVVLRGSEGKATRV